MAEIENKLCKGLAMWMMLQQSVPDDYVIATNESHSIREFLDLAFDYVGLNWSEYVVIDPNLFRPAEVQILRGDFSKAQQRLKWEPKVSFEELVEMMIKSDVNKI